MHFGHKSRAITLLFLNEIIPLAIPIPVLSDTNVYAKFEENR